MDILTYDATGCFDDLRTMSKRYELALRGIASDSHVAGYLTAMRDTLGPRQRDNLLLGVMDITLAITRMPREHQPLVREYASAWFERGKESRAQSCLSRRYVAGSAKH